MIVIGPIQVVRINGMKLWGIIMRRFLRFRCRTTLRLFLALLSEEVILGTSLFAYLIKLDATEQHAA